MRGDSARKDGQNRSAPRGNDGRGTRDRKGRKDTNDQEDANDHSAHGLVTTASDAIGQLYEHRAYWPLITKEDAAILEAMIPEISAIAGRARRRAA